MKTLYLHIGQYKTATTSIQKYCSDNSLYLNSKGFYYEADADKSYVDFYQHSPLAVSVFKRASGYLPDDKNNLTDDAFNEFVKDVRNMDTPNVILSSELFYSYGCDCDNMIKFRDLLSTIFKKIKIIVYLRRHDDFYISLYQQHAKSGNTDFLEAPPLEVIKSDHFKIAKQLGNWENVFGIENIIVRPFQKDSWRYESIISDFLFSIGIDTKVDDGEYKENSSISLQQLQLLNLLNKYLIPLDSAEKNVLKTIWLGITY